jgi:hypothetical protein
MTFPAASNQGLVMSGADGGIFTLGQATFHGSMGGAKLNQPIVGMAATPDGGGYWEVAADGGIFSFGDAAFYGSTGSLKLSKPIVGMATTPNGQGYWMAAADGGVFAFGNAGFEGSVPGQGLTSSAPVVGIGVTPSGKGYWIATSDGAVYAYGDAAYIGSLRGIGLAAPIVGLSAPWGPALGRGDDLRGATLNARSSEACGRLAQLVEQLAYNQQVVGSSPAAPTTLWTGGQLVASGIIVPRQELGFGVPEQRVRV